MSSTDIHKQNAEEALHAAIAKALETIDANMDTFESQYPDDVTEGGVYPPRSHNPQYPVGANYGWTTSFWTGQLWNAFQMTGDPKYRDAALAQVRSFSQRLEDQVDVDFHDLGFLYSLACVAATQLAQDRPESEEARETAIGAAEHLMTRYLPKAGVIQAWGDLDDVEQGGRVIVDSLMNMPLLYWVAKETGDSKYSDAADHHVAQLAKHIIRPDDTTYHTFHFDPVSGEAKFGSTHQGYADDSCWARGQAWAIYGFTLAYQQTRDQKFLIAANRAAEYYLDHLPQDQIPFWDLVFSDGDDEPRDSSSAAIAGCGLLELASIDPKNAERYTKAAEAMAVSLFSGYAPDLGDSNALLSESVYSKPRNHGVNEGSLWGDYFYTELLLRLTSANFRSPWVD